jgi:hypothetical protein
LADDSFDRGPRDPTGYTDATQIATYSNNNNTTLTPIYGYSISHLTNKGKKVRMTFF